MAKLVVYKLTSPSGKSYVGYTNNFARRMRQHRHDAMSGARDTLLCRAIRCHGWENFSKEVVEICATLNDALLAERRWAKETYSPAGYNTAEAGGASPMSNPEVAAKMSATKKGHAVSDETRRKISEAQRGKPRKLSAQAYKNNAEARRGAKRSDESRLRMSLAHVGKVMSPETRARMALAQQRRRAEGR